MSDTPSTSSRQEDQCIFVALTHDTLNPLSVMADVKSPKAGAIVLFAGRLCTRLQLPNLHLKASRYDTRQLRR